MSAIAKDNTPRRSPPVGGYARGEETRARIIAAALTVFAEEGYERASTRQIAKAAGVMPPALQYYFDSKEGLHRACAEVVLEAAERTLGPALAAATAVLDQRGQPQAALDALCDLLDALVDTSLYVKIAQGWSGFITRARGELDSPAGLLIHARLIAPLRELGARLVASATASPLDEAARLRGMAILSQVAVFSAHHRDGSLEALGWPDFNGSRGEAVKAVIRAHTRAALRD